MSIAIIGAGAIGSVIAGYLTKNGQDVTLVGREDHVDAINEQGLLIKGIRGEELIKVKAQTKLDCAYDFVIFTTKTQDLEEAYQLNNEYLEKSFVLSSQNGVQADNILSCHFERDQIFSSIVMFGATYTKPGEVTFNFEGNWILGSPFLPIDARTHAIADILKGAFSVVVSNNIIGMKYTKLFVNFNNCIPALTGKSMQETFSDIDLCRLSILLLQEGIDIVQKVKIEMVSLPDFSVDKIFGLVNMPIEQAASIINKTLTTLSKEPLYGSILQSIMRGKPSEVDFINGEVVCLAKQVHAKAPFNEKVLDMVHEVERSGKFFTIDEIKKEFGLI